MKVENMQWADMERLVTNRLNRLAMCKRGAVETDINNMKLALGKCPVWTPEEVKENRVKIASEVQAACKITIVQAKTLQPRQILDLLEVKLNKIASKFNTHPDAIKWHKAQDSISKQREERIAQIDGDFQDCSDLFRLGLKAITEFPVECEKLEAMVW